MMNEVNKTLFIPLYGKSQVSKKGIILNDSMAEKIWEKESFPIRGKSKSKWLTYNMAMRAKVFDDWTEEMLIQDKEAIVLHIGCGLDSRYQRNLIKLWRIFGQLQNKKIDCKFVLCPVCGNKTHTML